jgi:hypothetical protein
LIVHSRRKFFGLALFGPIAAVAGVKAAADVAMTPAQDQTTKMLAAVFPEQFKAFHSPGVIAYERAVRMTFTTPLGRASRNVEIGKQEVQLGTRHAA